MTNDWDYSYITDAAARTFLETLDSNAARLESEGYGFSRAVFKAARSGEELDPTGVAGVVEAYTQPKCAADEPMPAVTPL